MDSHLEPPEEMKFCLALKLARWQLCWISNIHNWKISDECHWVYGNLLQQQYKWRHCVLAPGCVPDRGCVTYLHYAVMKTVELYGHVSWAPMLVIIFWVLRYLLSASWLSQCWTRRLESLHEPEKFKNKTNKSQ